MLELPTASLADVAGIGVAGNFAGHLEQAGEAADFFAVDAEQSAPKGIFPWFMPGDGGFLGTFPLSSDEIRLPESDTPLNLQIEPEAGVLFDVEYDGDGVAAITPRALGAFNDCSIRRPTARKISEKKNWGPCSKGLATNCFAISELDADGATTNLRLASFLRRGGDCRAYGIDSPLPGYSYYGEKLIDWIVDRLRHQVGGLTPLEPVGEHLKSCGNPAKILVGIGATRYTEFGTQTFLEDDDESIVILYDSSAVRVESVSAAVSERRESSLEGASVLTQRVVAS